MGKIVIGITGSFGTGKTTVAKMFRKFGTEIIDADNIAKRLVKSREIKTRIKNEFGTTNKKKLAFIVFSDRKKVLKLNKIVHPAVIVEIKKKIRNSSKKFIVVDVPLLFEARMKKLFDIIIVVKCKKEIQIKRLMKKGFKRGEIIKRIKSQVSLREKERHADYIIVNAGSVADTKRQAEKIWNDIVACKHL